MSPSVSVRLATLHDSAAAVRVLIDSITIVCAADHQNDPATLQHWLRNKTVSHFEHWLAEPGGFTLVAEVDAQLCGVAKLHESGELRLCYVAPAAQRRGVGAALIRSLEAEAMRRGIRRLHLSSTANARPFYERLGFMPNGEPSAAFGVLWAYPYVKVLVAAPLLERRPATNADIPFLLELRRLTMTQHQVAAGLAPSEEERRARVLVRYECAEVLLDAGTPAGLLKVARDGLDWELIQIQLLPTYQAKGIGAELIRSLAREAAEAGASLRLTVLKGSPARRLYERLGFSVVNESEHASDMRLRAPP